MHWELALEVALVLALGVALFIATRPPVREISESISIQAREVAVFEVATDFRRWNPRAGWDPTVTSRYVGHAAPGTDDWKNVDAALATF